MYDVCKSCGRAIKWARTRAGKTIPLDPEPTATGNVVLEDGLALVLTTQAWADLDPAAPRWMPHWATCPTAHLHRKPKEPANGQ